MDRKYKNLSEHELIDRFSNDFNYVNYLNIFINIYKYILGIENCVLRNHTNP